MLKFLCAIFLNGKTDPARFNNSASAAFLQAREAEAMAESVLRSLEAGKERRARFKSAANQAMLKRKP